MNKFIIRRFEDPHRVYNEVFKNVSVNGRTPTVVSSPFTLYSSRYSSIRFAIVCIASVLMIFRANYEVMRGNTVVFREFWNIPFCILAPLLWPLRKNSFLNINHNLSGEGDNFPKPFLFLRRIGMRFILFDGQNIVQTFGHHRSSQFFTPLFPVPNFATVRQGLEGPPKIAILGDLRKENIGNAELNEVVQSLYSSGQYSIHIGSNAVRNVDSPTLEMLQLVNTSSRKEYLSLLRHVDVVLIFANSKAYKFRHSGTLMDAICSGAIVIAPNLPVLSSQVMKPVQVGLTYNELSEIPACLKHAIELYGELQANRPKWHASRQSVELATGGCKN